jgi:hypothetical protein
MITGYEDIVDHKTEKKEDIGITKTSDKTSEFELESNTKI